MVTYCTALCKMIPACLNFPSSVLPRRRGQPPPDNLPFHKHLHKFSKLSRNDFTQLCILRRGIAAAIRLSLMPPFPLYFILAQMCSFWVMRGAKTVRLFKPAASRSSENDETMLYLVSRSLINIAVAHEKWMHLV